MNDFEKLKSSVKEITAEIAKELELQKETEDVTELLQSHGKTVKYLSPLTLLPLY